VVGLTSLLLLSALPLGAVVVGSTNGRRINAFDRSGFAVSPAGDMIVLRSQPQGGGGYGSGY